MFHLRVFYLASTAGLAGCLCGAIADTLRTKFLKVNAQPQPQDEAEAILWGGDNAAVNPYYQEDDQEAHVHHHGAHHHEAVGGAHEIGAVGGGAHEGGAVGGVPAPIPAPAVQGGLQWLPFEMGGPVFPHPEVPSRSILEYKDFLLCYDNQTKTPAWTLEHVTKENAESLYVIDRPKREECRIPKEFRSGRGDYDANPGISSCFRQLLLAPEELHTDDRTDPHVFTNVAAFIKNETASNLMKDFNKYIRFLSKHHCNIYILSGTLYLPAKRNDGKWYMDYNLIGPKQVGIPTAFFKAILAENGDGRTFRLECFKFPNSVNGYRPDTKFGDLHCTRKELQKEAGFLIFEEVSDGKITERNLHPEFLREMLDPERHRPCPPPPRPRSQCPLDHE